MSQKLVNENALFARNSIMDTFGCHEISTSREMYCNSVPCEHLK